MKIEQLLDMEDGEIRDLYYQLHHTGKYEADKALMTLMQDVPIHVMIEELKSE